jgi:short-subunit dehydrogenase
MKPPITNGLRKTALITGASGGIGAELALLLAHNGYDLVLIARSPDKLAQLAERLEHELPISVRVLAKDLAQQGAPSQIHADLAAASVRVDVLVNNAGFGLGGRFAEVGIEGALEMIQLNVVAPTHLTKLFLDDMLEQGDGEILNVASIAGFFPGPFWSVYSASKAYVLSFSEALANELAGSGVTVTVLCPGPTATEFAARGSMQDSRVYRGATMDAGTVARIGYRGLMRGQTLVIPGWRNRLLAFAVRLTPRRTTAGIARRLFETSRRQA